MGTTTDIDIDVPNRDAVLRLFEHTPAATVSGNRIEKHNSGVYFHRMPHDPLTGLATIDHKDAEARGYFKIDVLNINVYQGIRDEAHLQALMDREPVWSLLQESEFVAGQQLFQIHNRPDVLRLMKPQTIEQLAMVIAMIRPAKLHLIGRSWAEVEREIWVKPADPTKKYYKKAHAVCYATLIVVQMNRICEELMAEAA